MREWAALFDWDGVIVDTSAAHEESWERLAEEERRALPPGHFRRGFGRKNEAIISSLLGWTRDPAEIRRLSLRKEAGFREILGERGIAPLPGVRAWVDALRAAGVPCVVASSTHRENIEFILSRLDWHPFDALVSGEDVEHGKPDPEVFLRAAAAARRPPGRCAVLEDAPVGIQAARAAGMRVAGVAGTHPPERLREADLVVARLDELPATDPADWFGAGVGPAGTGSGP